MAWQQQRLSCCALAGKGHRGTCPTRAEGARCSPPHEIMRIGIREIQAWLLQQVSLLPSATVSRAAALRPEELQGCALHGCIRRSAWLQHADPSGRRAMALAPRPAAGRPVHARKRDSFSLQDDAYVAPLHGTRNAPQLHILSGMPQATALSGNPFDTDRSGHAA